MSETTEQTDEELAAAWGAETDAETPVDSAQAARELNQAEIDNLLGFDKGPADGEARTGMQKIISSGLVSYERLPMLEIVFDRLVRIMSTSLRNFTSDNVEVGIDNILSLRFGDYLNSIPLPAMLAVFKAEEWDNQGLMVIEFGDDLFDRRRAAGRPPRHRGDAHRGPPLHHHRTHAGRAADPGRAGRPVHQFRPAVSGDVPVRAAGGQSALRHHQPAVQRRHPGPAAHRHGGSRRPRGTAAAVRHAGAGARTAAATVHGRKVRPRLDLGNPSGRTALAHRSGTVGRAG